MNFTKILFLLLLIFFLFSCSKNETVTKEEIKINKDEKIQSKADIKFYPSKEACGVKSCALEKYLEGEEQASKFNLEKANYFQSRFGSLVNRYENKDKLFKSPEFKKFVEDFYLEYFSGKAKYSYDERNFIWYVFLPKMIALEFGEKKGGSSADVDAITQSVKEKYYATYEEKEAVLQVYKDDLEKKVAKMDLSNIDKKRLKEDKKYFEEIILTPHIGLYDQVILGITSKIWPEKGQLEDLVNFTLNVFFKKIAELGIEKEYFYSFIGEKEEIINIINTKVEKLEEKYSLSEKIPTDRYIRQEELLEYIFNNLEYFNTKGDFTKDTLELRHYNLLLYSFPDAKLYNMATRTSQINSINNFMVENLYKYSKSIKDIKY